MFDGTVVRIQGVITWAADGFFYCQALDRSSAIRVNWSQPVTEGQTVEVTGTMTTAGGERRIDGSSVATR